MTQNDLEVTLKAILGKSDIKNEVAAYQKILNKYSVKLNVGLHTGTTRRELKSLSKEITRELNEAFHVDLSGKDVFSSLNQQLLDTTKQMNKNLSQIADTLGQSLAQAGTEAESSLSPLDSMLKTFDDAKSRMESLKEMGSTLKSFQNFGRCSSASQNFLF